jgi:hypothetical protein
MPQSHRDVTPPVAVAISVEGDDHKRYRIETSDLEAISSQIRGKRGLSVFNSIILPIGVTILTAFATTPIFNSAIY